MEFHGPWYTLDEAQDILQLRPSELRHEITLGSILPVLYCKPRDMLVHSRDKRGWTAYGVCRYRGHVSAHPDFVAPLFDGQEAFIGKGAVRLLEAKGVQPWRSNYPFKRELPHSPITEWKGTELVPEDCLQLSATPMPVEQTTVRSLVHDFAKALAKSAPELPESSKRDLAKLDQVEKYQLNFRSGEPFTPDDIRIPASEIENFQAPQGTPQSDESITSKKRESRIRRVIRRAIIKHPNATAQGLWDILYEHWDSDNTDYDTAGTIQMMDELAIEWKTTKGESNEVKRSSFDSIVSSIRKEIREAKAG